MWKKKKKEPDEINISSQDALAASYSVFDFGKCYTSIFFFIWAEIITSAGLWPPQAMYDRVPRKYWRWEVWLFWKNTIAFLIYVFLNLPVYESKHCVLLHHEQN